MREEKKTWQQNKMHCIVHYAIVEHIFLIGNIIAMLCLVTWCYVDLSLNGISLITNIIFHNWNRYKKLGYLFSLNFYFFFFPSAS